MPTYIRNKAVRAGWLDDDLWTVDAMRARVDAGRAEEVRERLEQWWSNGYGDAFSAVYTALDVFPGDPTWVERLRSLDRLEPEKRAEVIRRLWANGLDEVARSENCTSALVTAAVARGVADDEIEPLVRRFLDAAPDFRPDDVELAVVCRDRGMSALAREIVVKIIDREKKRGHYWFERQLAASGFFSEVYDVARKRRGNARDDSFANMAEMLGRAGNWSGADLLLGRLKGPGVAFHVTQTLRSSGGFRSWSSLAG